MGEDDYKMKGNENKLEKEEVSTQGRLYTSCIYI